ncbi:MAG: hypothetical protein D6B26_00760, partial [Spirochaetaceae bacterium]
FWAAALAAIAAILAITAVLRHRDSAYALVISWALLGIALARATAEPWLSGWAAALALLTLLVALLAPMLMRRPDTYQ